MAIAIVAAVLNARHDIRSFYIWLGTNTFWIVYDVLKGAPAQSILFVVYTFISLYGIVQWRKEARNAGRTNLP